MAQIDTALDATRVAVNEFIATAESCAPVWLTPRAPGKWSPSQLAEHVARALEQSAHVAAGAPSVFPTFPAFLRPLVRALFFNRVLKQGSFPRARTSPAMNPASGPASPAEARARLNDAFARFDRECRALAARGGRVNSTIFGVVAVEDYVRFQELHTRHHRTQFPDVKTEPGSVAL